MHYLLFIIVLFIISPGMVLTNILRDLESDKPIADGLTARQVLYIDPRKLKSRASVMGILTCKTNTNVSK